VCFYFLVFVCGKTTKKKFVKKQVKTGKAEYKKEKPKKIRCLTNYGSRCVISFFLFF